MLAILHCVLRPLDTMYILIIFLYFGGVREVGTVGKIFDCQPDGLGFSPRPGRGLNLGRPSFATSSVDRNVKPLV